MSGQVVVMEVARLEAAHLAGLVSQFAELVEESDPRAGDPAIARLVPSAYSDDADAAREFRELTESDLLARRRRDATAVLESLGETATIPTDVTDSSDPALLETVVIRLDPPTVQAWLRTLAAVRLVLASRLGISDADDHDPDDPRFGVYEWLGYRLDGLVAAVDGAS